MEHGEGNQAGWADFSLVERALPPGKGSAIRSCSTLLAPFSR